MTKEETKLEKNQKMHAIEDLLKSPAWMKYLKPWLEGQIQKHSNILNMKDDAEHVDYIIKKRLAHAYQNMLRVPQVWINEINVKKEA